MTTAPRVLSLYRAIIKLGKSWKGEVEEKQYILSEARKVFREHRDANSKEEVESLIEEGEHRLNYAQHYGIAYPRLHHASQFKRRVYMDVPQQASADREAVLLPSDQDTAAKLAAAMQRRKAKLERPKE
ncbi:hypothetical protein WJX81_000015 [Elliptochloris bilobata]|uniref:Complex 1 LYR protein domain-containing protein n=1 Tax=Elliptochloris bilobata TaxID=381761 RepID=A0AAW1SID2_9CHLO